MRPRRRMQEEEGKDDGEAKAKRLMKNERGKKR